MSRQTQISKIISSFLILLVTVSTLLGIRHSFYVYLLVIGSLLSFLLLRTTKAGSAFHLLTGLFWGSAVLILTSALLSMLGFALQKWVLIIPALLLLFLVLRTKHPLEFDIRTFTTEELILFGFAIISFISHVVSIKGFLAPILHDPIQHATWAKQIFNTGKIEYFYSPGLHIISAFGMMVDNISVATYVLRFTNLFNGLMFIPAFYYLKFHFKSKFIALIGASLFLIGHFPTNLFFTAGKNALLVASSFMLLLLALFKIEMGKWTKLIVINLLVFVLILTHYPLAAIGLALIGGIIVLEREFKNILLVLGGSVLGILWGFQKYHYQIASQQTSMFTYVEPFPVTVSGLANLLSSAFENIRLYFASSYNLTLFYSGLFGFLIIGILSLRQKQLRGFLGFIGVFSLLAIALNSISFLRNSVYIIYMTQQNVFAIFVYVSIAICLGLFIDYLSLVKAGWRIDLIVMTILVGVVITVNVNTFKVYRNVQTNLNLVSANDIAAYQWIEKNIDEQDIILNNAAQNNRAEIVYGSEGGTWIPVFADRQVAMPFTEFSDSKTHEIYYYYQKILEDSEDCSNYEALLDRGVEYYYQDSQGVFGPQIIASRNPENFQPIYDESGVVIYQIQGCN